MKTVQLCSTAQNVGIVNIGAATSQSLIPSLSITLTVVDQHLSSFWAAWKETCFHRMVFDC